MVKEKQLMAKERELMAKEAQNEHQFVSTIRLSSETKTSRSTS